MTHTDRQPLRILYSHPHVLGRPGIESIALEQIRALAAAGSHITVACAATLVEIQGVERCIETLRLGGVRIPHRAIGVDRAYRLHDRLVARILARSAGEFDVVHTWPLAAESTLRTARAMDVAGIREAPNTHTRHAYTIDAEVRRTLGLPAPPGHSHAFDDDRLTREEREYELADVVVVASHAARETFLAAGVPASKISCRPYGYDPARFSAPPSPHRRYTAAFIARGEPRKGLHVALEAWFESGLTEAGRLIICGRIESEYRRSLEALLDHPSIVEKGWTTDIPEILKDSEALVLPSFEEGSALVTYEAQACGCALLVSRSAGAYITDGVEGVLHEPGDVATLADQFRGLFADRARLEEMQAAATQNVRTYSWAALAATQLDIYRRAMDDTAV